ncbi:c-type cytochrome [Humitalea sp. 24SJ18S-53]|uniref:c-type cytochrome n=1 Tax=Humitalea sp. 24SJ18S-53 TaxID=3422307 RepID=UPI003D67E90C
MTARIRLLAILAATIVIGGVAAQQAPVPALAPTTPGDTLPGITSAPGADEVARGHYLALAADCMPCHTGPGAKPFAGGLALDTPFGSVLSPNITPDIATGIGGWSEAQFWGALHDGVGRRGEDLYPVMPFTSYTGMTRDDARAIFAYLRSLEPVHAPRQPNGLAFPFSIRATLGFWRELFFRPAAFVADPAKSTDWNRGAYLVNVLGHCGECHTPRNIMGAVEPSRALSGAVVDGWFAPNISGSTTAGIGGWTVDRLTAWLRTGNDTRKGSVFGPMQEVVGHSLSQLNDADVRAIATYLTSTAPQRPGVAASPHLTGDEARAGAALYSQNCSGCHQPQGAGIPGAIPPLAGNQAVAAAAPNNVVQAMLNGLPAASGLGAMPSFAAALDDAQMATLANYVRNTWGNTGRAEATPALVASLRAAATVSPAGTEAARALCPAVNPMSGAVGATSLPDGAAALMRGSDSYDLLNRTDLLLRTLRRDNPTASGGDLTDALIGAYCPAVANDPTLSADDKRSRLALFRSNVLAGIAALPVAAPR